MLSQMATTLQRWRKIGKKQNGAERCVLTSGGKVAQEVPGPKKTNDNMNAFLGNADRE
jgi:hypothetical protein